MEFLDGTKDFGQMIKRGNDRPLFCCDAEYTEKETERRSVSGDAVIYGGVVVWAASRGRHCVTLSTTGGVCVHGRRNKERTVFED